MVPRSFRRRKVHGGMHAAVQAQKNDDVGDEAAKEERAAGFSGGATLCGLISKGFRR